MMHRSLVLLVALGCGTRGGLYTDALKPLPLLATRSSVVQVVPQTRRAVVLRPGTRPLAVPISPGARSAAAVPGSDAVVILGGGLKSPKLDLVDAASATSETLDVPGLFDRVTLSPDGRYAVLTYAPGVPSPLAARNLNEIALVELPSRAVVRIQLDTESLAPRAVVFGPDEPDRRLVAVALERGVALFDARRPELPPRRISIRPQGVESESSVLEAIFSSDARFLFVRASRVDDVIVVELEPTGSVPRASVNFVAGGTGLTDIELAPGGVLAVYAQSREAMRLDPRGVLDNVLRLPLPDTLTTARRLGDERVLFFDASSRHVTAWDVLDGRSGTAILDAPAENALVAAPLGKALFAHPSTAAASGAASLSVVSVEDASTRLRARIQSIQLLRPAAAPTLDAAQERLFFTPQNDATVVTLDLRTLAIAQVTLDTAASQILYLPDGDQLAVVHAGNPLGDVTFVPAGGENRGQAVRFSDFALAGALDRPREDQ